VVDPTSLEEIEAATEHATPTFPFSSILFRATGVTATYSRMAVGEDPAAVLAFARGEPLTPILKARRIFGGLELRWKSGTTPYTLEGSRDLIDFQEITSGITEEADEFLYHPVLSQQPRFFYRLKRVP